MVLTQRVLDSFILNEAYTYFKISIALQNAEVVSVKRKTSWKLCVVGSILGSKVKPFNDLSSLIHLTFTLFMHWLWVKLWWRYEREKSYVPCASDWFGSFLKETASFTCWIHCHTQNNRKKVIMSSVTVPSLRIKRWLESLAHFFMQLYPYHSCLRRIMGHKETYMFYPSSKSSFQVHRKVGQNAQFMECYLTLFLEMEVILKRM